jgi:hypothetical protein
MRKHLTESVPMPRWWIYLVFLGFALDYIADEDWMGLAVYVAVLVVGYGIVRWLKHRLKAAEME